ncbi:MAG: glycosyltransferase family 1 protein [Opitutaceae bacterium]|nr:glycosyltransferase family 1 protein [Opitutaceae bacterium]
MRLLFLSDGTEDYLADSVLLGLRELVDVEVVDLPRRDFLYADCPTQVRAQVRGHGFTLYTGLLRADPCDRSQIAAKLAGGYFDLVIIADAWRAFGHFVQWRPYLNPANTIFLDGADTPQVYCHAVYWWRRPYYWGLPRASRGFLYFKREWTSETQFNLWHRAVPRFARRFLPQYGGLRRIAFAIPGSKIVPEVPAKTKRFAQHLVDPEVAAIVPEASVKYAFASEADYYADLQQSRYSVTTKRAGWDCLRHYEIAANGCVPCFRDLNSKPIDCAPHGLVADVNCLAYRTAAELQAKVAGIGEVEYGRLAGGALRWARENSTAARTRALLAVWRQRQDECGN